MTVSKLKESELNDCAQVSKEVIKTCMKKKQVPRLEIKILKKAWKNSTGGIKDMYQKILYNFLKSCF